MRGEVGSDSGRTRSKKVLVGLRRARRSRMMDSAPLRWLFMTVEEPVRTIWQEE